MTKQLTRDEAYELLTGYNESDALVKHALAVEAVMRYAAKKHGEDEELWGIVGLLHDLDYEQYPEEHTKKTTEILTEKDIDPVIVRGIESHAYGLCNETEPESLMEKTLYAYDELTGLVNATVLMRPSKSVLDLEVKSVKKKFKSKGFAAGVNREVIKDGCERLGIDLGEAIEDTIMGMREAAEALDLVGSVEA